MIGFQVELILGKVEDKRVQQIGKRKKIKMGESHTVKVGKKLLLLSCQISPLFWHMKLYSQRCKMIATK
jgi:hypothetical protein